MCIYIYIYYKSCIAGLAATLALDPGLMSSTIGAAAASISGVSELDPAVGTAFVGGDKLAAGSSAGRVALDGRGYFGGTAIGLLRCWGGRTILIGGPVTTAGTSVASTAGSAIGVGGKYLATMLRRKFSRRCLISSGHLCV